MMAINTVELGYDGNERANSQMNEQTTPEDHTNSIERKTIIAACRHMPKIILRV